MDKPGRVEARRAARRVLGVLVAALGVLGLGPVSLLIFVAETRSGRLFGGVAAAVLGAASCGVALLWRAPARPWGAAGALALATAAGLGLALARGTPSTATRPARSTGLVSRATGEASVPRYSPANLLPEVDQVKLGVTLATRLMPVAGRGWGRAIREATMGLYRSIEADPEARGLGPVTHFAARELLGVGFDSGHSFAYVPEPRPGERLGLLVFLHGNGGNFQVLPWALRPFAEEHRCAVLCPTFGCGFWGEGGVEAVERARLDASARWPIDPDRVYLGGISDGGVGVTRSGSAHPDRYRALIYVSPTMHLDELAAPGYVNGWRGRPILVLQGGRDRNVPRSTVDPAVDLLRRQGAAVDYRVFPDEDHFLFFSRRDAISGLIGGRVAADDRPSTPSSTEESR